MLFVCFEIIYKTLCTVIVETRFTKIKHLEWYFSVKGLLNPKSEI